MQSQRIRATLLLISILLALVGSSVPAVRAASRSGFNGPGDRPWRDDTIRFERISNEQGLSVSVVNAIAQDRQGFLWFATQDGLNRFDGYDFKIYKHDPTRPGSLSANWINAVWVDAQGVLWVGTRGGGLEVFDHTTETFTRIDSGGQSLSSDVITALYEDRHGCLWIGTDRGPDCMNKDGRITRLVDEPGSPAFLGESTVRAIVQDRQGALWFSASNGLVRYLPGGGAGAFTIFQHDPHDPFSLSNSNVANTLIDQHGRVWVATRGGGLNRLSDDGRSFAHWRSAKQGGTLSSDVILDIYEDPDGILWLATWDGGLNRFDPATAEVTVYRSEPENSTTLSSNALQTIFADASGLVWIGTFGGGLSKFDPASERFQHYFYRSGDANSLSSDMVWALLEQDGRLWIGADAGLDSFDRGSGTFAHYRYATDPDLGYPVGRTQALLSDRRGRIWAGSVEGYLSLFDEEAGRFTNYPITMPSEDGGLSPVAIYTLAEDRSGRIWVGAREGLFRYDPRSGGVTSYLSNAMDPHTLSAGGVTAISLARDGRLWVGTDMGLNAFDPNTGAARRLPLVPGNGSAGSNRHEPAIQSIYEDDTGILWIGASGSGLLRYDPATGAVREYHEADGLPNDTVYGILPDDAGNLWLSTNKGLSRFNLAGGTFTNFDARDGLQSNEFNSNAYARGADGELFFGGINGVTAFNPRNIRQNSYTPPVVLTSLTQSGQPLNTAALDSLQTVTLVWPNNFFEFEFAGLSFRQSDQNRYAYKLEGFDRDWVFTGANRYGRYANLPGGSYTLHIKAANSDGVWNEIGTSLRVTVVPPFWQTWTFRGGLLLALLLAVAAGYRLRVRSVEQHNRALSRLVQERTREIEQRHQELEALYHADSELYRTIDLDDVLKALVDTAVRILHADKGALLVWDARRERLTARAARGFHPETLPMLSFRPGEGVAGTVGVSGEPAWVENVALDARPFKQVTDREGICAFLQTPIKVGEQIFGVFSADYLAPRTFSEQDVRLLGSLAERAALAIQNAQIHEQTQAQAIVEERSRLARELHDAVTQTLFSASLLAEALPAVYESDPGEGRALLHELRQLSRGALAEMRTLLMELRPSALAEADLGDLLRQLGEAAAGREGIPVTVRIDPPGPAPLPAGMPEGPLAAAECPLPPDVHIALYRIAQEALNNALKYAQAERITIDLSRTPAQNGRVGQVVSLAIRDDGRGFDPERVPSNHFGLGIMRERAEAVGANFEVLSRPGAGTQIQVHLKIYPSDGSGGAE